MDSRILWLPVAAVTVCQPAQATVYLTLEQAQALMFGNQALAPVPLALGAGDIASIEQQTGTRYYPGALRAWKGPEGYFYTDAVVGKHDLISYAVAVGLDGKVRQVEILDYRESYGGEVRSSAWRRQFVGRSHADPLRIGKDVQNISGATLSCAHVTDGIRRLLAIHAIAFPDH